MVEYIDFPELKVYNCGGYCDSRWIPNSLMVRSVEEADIVLMPGGSDWNPELYHQRTGRHTHPHENVDIYQLDDFIKAVQMKKFIVGICRGAQLLGIAAGGNLIQDVTNHAGNNHPFVTINPALALKTNSLHHQMVDWFSIPEITKRGRLLGWSNSLSSRYLNGDNKEITYAYGVPIINNAYREPEIFYFPSFSAFGIQGHPEMRSMPDNTIEFILHYIKLFYKSHLKYNTEIDPVVEKRLEHFAVVYPTLRHIQSSKKLIVPETLQLTAVVNSKIINKQDTVNEQSNKKNRNSKFQTTGKW